MRVVAYGGRAGANISNRNRNRPYQIASYLDYGVFPLRILALHLPLLLKICVRRILRRPHSNLARAGSCSMLLLCTTLVSSYTSPDVGHLKKDFRLAAARANRGFTAGGLTRAELIGMAEALEAAATASSEEFSPTTSPMLLGRWYLDFTDAADVLSLSLLPFPAEIGDVYQEVRPRGEDLDRFVVDNAVELLPIGSGAIGALTGMTAKGLYSVEGACKTLSPTKVSLAFVGGKVQPIALPFALPAVGGALPDLLVERLQELLGERVYLETTYLDEDLRIGRGPGKELYVLSKRGPLGTLDAAIPEL